MKIAKKGNKPIVTVFVFGLNNLSTSSSLKKQTNQDFEVTRLDRDEFTNENIKSLITQASGEYLIFLEGDTTLYPNAVKALLDFANSYHDNKPDMIFSDHDVRNEYNEVIKQFFKPGWSPDLFLVNNYLNNAVMFLRNTLIDVLDEVTFKNLKSLIYHLSLKISEIGKVQHFPGILFSFQENQLEINEVEFEEIRAKALTRRKENAHIALNKYSVPTVIRNLESEPLVSIIIPTCFKDNYIDACLQSIYDKSTYKNYEIVVLDNSRKGIEYAENRLQSFKCRIVPIDLDFNWAKFNNIGARHANGEVYIFLNDDIEIINNDWLERLVSNAIRKEIGVVGPLLLYPDRKVQHAGIFMVDRNYWSIHSFAGLDENFSGYHNILHYQRNCLIMTGACHTVSRNKFEEIGGYDESFSIIQNDVDFCLRLWEKGYYQLYLPEIQLFHKEMASRRNVPEGAANEIFGLKWKELIEKGDPFYNKYLSFDRNDYSPKDINSSSIIMEDQEVNLKRMLKKALPKPIYEGLKKLKTLLSS